MPMRVLSLFIKFFHRPKPAARLLPLFQFIFFMLVALPLGNIGIFAQSPESAAANPLPYTDAAVVWRGFTHQWTYNHRLNRLGSYVLNTDFAQFPYHAQAVHTSATGVGGDVGLFDVQYSYVAMRDVAVQSGSVTIEFSGKEGDMHNIVKHLLADSKIAHSQAPSDCIVVLNGFDILSERKADKISLLHIAVSDAEYLPATNKIKFDISASMEATCKSFECNRFNQKFNYTVRVHYLIFMSTPTYNNNEQSEQTPLHATEQTVRRVYNWDKDAEIDLMPEQHTISGIKGNSFSEAILAFKSISLHLDRDHWLLDWHSAIMPENYDAQNGKFRYSLDLLFKQWDETMKRGSANPRVSRFSGKRRGWAILESTVCMLQFEQALVRHADKNGIAIWTGHNQSANSDASVQRYELLLDDTLLHSKQTDLYKQRQQEQAQINEQYQKYIAELERKKAAKK